jgi:hypothetical protein
MKIYKFMGKVMLVVLLPFVFTVISTILIAATISILGALSGYNTFSNCFVNAVGNEQLIIAMLGISSVFTVIHLVIHE